MTYAQNLLDSAAEKLGVTLETNEREPAMLMLAADVRIRRLMSEHGQTESFWCKFGIHRWSKWCTPFKRPNAMFDFTFQRCHCTRCLKFKEKTL